VGSVARLCENNFTQQWHKSFKQQRMITNVQGVQDYRIPWILLKVKVKQSLYTPWRRLGGEDV
jgi:hypothetical protein